MRLTTRMLGSTSLPSFNQRWLWFMQWRVAKAYTARPSIKGWLPQPRNGFWLLRVDVTLIEREYTCVDDIRRWNCTRAFQVVCRAPSWSKRDELANDDLQQLSLRLTFFRLGWSGEELQFTLNVRLPKLNLVCHSVDFWKLSRSHDTTSRGAHVKPGRFLIPEVYVQERWRSDNFVSVNSLQERQTWWLQLPLAATPAEPPRWELFSTWAIVPELVGLDLQK